jgi:DNA polymerase-1
LETLPGWSDRLARARAAPPRPAPDAAPRPALPKAAAHYAGRTTLVASADGAAALVALARQRPLSHAGIDTEFRYDRPGVAIDRDRTANDPRSLRPLVLSLALAEPVADSGFRLFIFVVDLRRPETLRPLADVLRLPIPFVGHYAHAELLCLLRLGLPEPLILWDTWVCEKALHLGRHHKRYRLAPDAYADDADEAGAREQAEEEERWRLSLAQTCLRHGFAHPFAGDKDRLQRSFLDHPDDAEFTPEQVEYAAADAEAAARLYTPQVAAAAQGGLLSHLATVEMPWTVTNARIVWNGFRVDPDRAREVRGACERHAAVLGPQLAALGVTKPRSHRQLQELFGKLGLIELFRRGGRLSFDREHLDEFQAHHPAIALVRAARRVADLQEDKLLTGEFIGADGRVHPDHRQLGSDTGRQSCRWPNVSGLGKVFRPLVVPNPGRGLGEVDWSQIEVGIAAAVYGDAALVAMFNSGDVYSAMAQDFYRDQFGEADRLLPGREFKRRHRALRDRMKTCTLGIIYGLTPHGLALRLKTSKSEAAALQDRFMAMFPVLRHGLREAAATGAIRGHAATVTGLRRYRAAGAGRPSGWERNWMTNHPVQGTAAVLFKLAGNRLDRLYRRHDAWIVVPMHDAFVFEAPLGVIREVAELTASVMGQVVREYFPELDAQVEVNADHPECWNKDGHTDSLARWMDNPTYSL